MTIKNINDEIRKVEKELIRFSKRGFNINGIEFSGDVMSTKAKLITLQEVRELIERKSNTRLCECIKILNEILGSSE